MKKKSGFTDVVTITVIAIIALVAFAFGGCTTIKKEVSKLEASIKQNARDFRDNLLAKMDLKYEKVKPVEPAPGTPPVGGIPNFVWKYGGEYRFQKCTEAWWGKMTATPNRVVFDYTGAPQWFTKSGTSTPFIVCAFYWDGALQAYVGGKFDWVGFSRTSRDLDHITSGKYNGWDNQYPGQSPAYVVMLDYGENAGRWLIFKAQ